MSKIMNTKKRMIIFLAGGVIVLGALVGAWYLYHRHEINNIASANIGSAPAVLSIPGGGVPPSSYVKEQNKQNAQQVLKAEHSGGSAFPTITRTGFIGSPSYFADQAAHKAPKQCPIDKVVYMFKPNPASCTVANLRLARTAGVTAEELRCQACSCPSLRLAGFTAGQLSETGYTAADLKKCGYSLQQLMDAGFSARQLRAAGFTAAQMKKAGFSAAQLKGAGYSAAALAAAGLSTKKDNLSAKLKKICDPAALAKAREQGVSADQLRKDGCGLAALKAAGYTAAQLKAAGYTAKQLKSAGFSAAQLKKAGFTAAQLKKAGFTAGQLKNAGFTAKQLKAAGFSAKQLRAAGFSAAQLKKAGFTAAQLRAAGFTKGDLLRAGFTPKQAGYNTPAKVKAAKTVQKSIKRLSSDNGASAILPSISPAYDVGESAANLRALQKLQQQEMTAQQQQDAVQEMQGQMSVQAQKLLAGWSNSNPQQYEVGIQTPVFAKGNGTGSSANGLTGPVIKAGTIMFAVLNTGIDSDNKSPIMATVLTGKLKGAKLLGKFDRTGKKVLVRFNLLNIPSYNKSIPVNIVAIDQRTANTAVSGNVNNHYLLRYGSLFASSFVAGLSQGILATSSETHCLLGVICQTEPKSKLSAAEYVALGLGNVGQQYSSHMSNNFNTPPTVKVPGGTGVGLLFMKDLTLPKALPTKEKLK